jgi:hypothetical protein
MAQLRPSGCGFLMMNRLHMTSWGLLVGAMGQCALFNALLPRLPSWIVFGALLPPWLMVYAISFCRQAPFGPRRFRQFLIFAMGWYALMTLTAEGLHLYIHPAPYGHFPNTLAHGLTFFGALSFVVLIRVCRQLSRLEAEGIS